VVVLFLALRHAESLAVGGGTAAKVILLARTTGGRAAGRGAADGMADGGDHVDIITDIGNEVDVVDGAGARGGGEAEDGLTHAHVGALANEVVVEAAGGHVEGYDLLLLAVDGDILRGCGGHLRAAVGAVEPPQVTGTAGEAQVSTTNDQKFLVARNVVVVVGPFQHQAHVVGSCASVHGEGVALRVVGEAAGLHAGSIARGPVGTPKLVGVGLGVVAVHQAHVVHARAERRAAGGEAHHELRLALGEGGGDGILHVVEAVAVAALEGGGDGDVGHLLAVDGERGLAAAVGEVEAEHHAEVLLHTTIII